MAEWSARWAHNPEVAGSIPKKPDADQVVDQSADASAPGKRKGGAFPRYTAPEVDPYTISDGGGVTEEGVSVGEVDPDHSFLLR